jgi:integrase
MPLMQLPNGCWCSPPIIQPKDWRTNIKKYWSICYRFHEPGQPSFPVMLKGMNDIPGFRERKKFTLELIDQHLELLRKGYNPRLKKMIEPVGVEISSYKPIILALNFAHSKLKGVPGFLTDVKSCIKGISANVGSTGELSIAEIRTKHLERILENCAETNPRFSASRHNKYRSYLVKLFKILKKYEAVEHNPAVDIDKLKAVKRIRRTTTADERKKINDHLRSRDYPFWRFVQIFFHSGSRESELMRLKGKDVNLRQQTFTCLVKKGKEYREMEGVIKNSVLPLWEEIMKDCRPDQYLFSKGLLPGEQHIRPDQVGRRWHNMVKRPPQKKYARWGGLGIDADLYSLKHTNTTQVVRILGDEDAARLNKHTSTAMVRNIYDVERGDRQAERLKHVENEF